MELITILNLNNYDEIFRTDFQKFINLNSFNNVRVFEENVEINHQLDINKNNLLALFVTGSRAYGTHHENSDYDFKGIYLPSLKEFLLSPILEQNMTEQINSPDNDVTIHSLPKLFKLLKKVNPNILETIFTEDFLYLHPILKQTIMSDESKYSRSLFLSTRAKHSFMNYANDQLHRIENHRRWLENPVQKPKREDFGLSETSSISKEKLKAIKSLGKKFSEDFLITNQETTESLWSLNEKEMKYQDAKDEYDRYRKWRNNRNPKRAEIEEKCGFDTKHALHLVRLLCMAREIADQKTIKVLREDPSLLKKIRDGFFTYEQLIEYVEELKDEIEEAFDATDLQECLNIELIETIFLEIINAFYNGSKG